HALPISQSLVAEGYHRLNRDEAGGTLRSLLPALGRAIETGATRIVLDNTYASRKTRAEEIHPAAAQDTHRARGVDPCGGDVVTAHPLRVALYQYGGRADQRGLADRKPLRTSSFRRRP